MIQIETRIELLEQILAPWQSRIGADFEGYKNHCYRMLHFCFALAPQLAEDERTKMIVAAAHHDIGLWSAGTVDYLPPSIGEAKKYCEHHQLMQWAEEIALLISEHHKLKPYTGAYSQTVEAFRKADLVDFSLGTIRQGVSKATVKQVQRAFPNSGFHKFLLKGAWAWFREHPVSMPPFMKW